MSAIAELMSTDDIFLDLEVPSKSRLLQEIARHMEAAHGLPRTSVFQSLSHRERLGSTALGAGVAIPHARIGELHRVRGAYARLRRAIPFAAPDGLPVSDVLVLLVPQQVSAAHFEILAEATRMFADRRFRQRLSRCEAAREARQAFADWPCERPGN